MRKRSRSALWMVGAVAVVLVVSLAGCAASGSSPATSTSSGLIESLLPHPSTREAKGARTVKGSASTASRRFSDAKFRAKVNGLCRKMNAVVIALPRDVTPQADFYDLSAMLSAAPRWSAELSAVKAPAGAATRYARLLRLNAEQVRLLGQEFVAATRGEVATSNRIIRRGSAVAQRYNRLATELGLPTCSKNAVPSSARKPPLLPRRTASLVGSYVVVGDVLTSHNISGEPAGTRLDRAWAITETCNPGGCELELTRDLAAESDVRPISAVLKPSDGGWTGHFIERQGCPGPGSSVVTTEYSSWMLRTTPGGLEAIEHGHSPAVTTGASTCKSSASVIRWQARKVQSSG